MNSDNNIENSFKPYRSNNEAKANAREIATSQPIQPELNESVNEDADDSLGGDKQTNQLLRTDIERECITSLKDNYRSAIDVVSLPETTIVLDYPELANSTLEPEITIEDDVNKENLLKGSKCYLIGTTHFSTKSQQEVEELIQSIQPDGVAVELCKARLNMLFYDEKTLLEESKKMNTWHIVDIIKEMGAAQGLMNILFLTLSAHVTEKLGMAPGGEFRAAYRAANKLCGVHFTYCDRPINITMKRAFGLLTFWQRLKLLYSMISSLGHDITPEEVEECKNRDVLEQFLLEMAAEYPILHQVILHERDLYMSVYLKALLQELTMKKYMRYDKERQGRDVKWQPVTCVAVVGIGHQAGIVKAWNRTDIDMSQLVRIPEQSRTSRLIGYTVRGAFYGVIGYFTILGLRRTYHFLQKPICDLKTKYF